MSLQDSITLLLLGQFATVLVVVITNYLNRRHNRQLLESEIQVRKRIEHLEKQLMVLYGPIDALLSMNRALLKLTYDPETGKYTQQVPRNLWVDLRDNVIRPNNSSIVEILKNNFHLIEGEDIPQSVIKFIIHAEVWERTEKYDFQMSDYLSGFAFPAEFAEHIRDTTAALKGEYQILVSRSNDRQGKPSSMNQS